MLELTKPAVLGKSTFFVLVFGNACLSPLYAAGGITIGRYQDEHPCNAQSITILAGNSPTNLQQILNVNLKNAGGSQVYALQHNTPVWTGNVQKLNPWDVRHEKTTVVRRSK